MTVHKSVLLHESIDALNLESDMIVVDATLGGGGHSREILKIIGNHGKLIVFDQDQTAIEKFVHLTKDKKNVFAIHANFAALKKELAKIGIEKVDGILADFGISSDQLDDAERGMSFSKNGKLDMRMDQTKGMTAQEIVNSYSEEDLVRILRNYGDEKFARSIAKGIAMQRTLAPIRETAELVEIIGKSVPEKYKHQRIHFATRTFQALRMEVNKELESISSFLVDAVDVLNVGGRLAVITFHSGEDMIGKKFFRENARGCICPPQLPVCTCGIVPKIKIITKKPVLPSVKEVQDNPRSRSAKLRVVEKM